MDFQIREAISANMKGNNPSEIRAVVEDAIQRGEEHLLPGLGVFFEKWWKNTDDTKKDAVLNELATAFAQ
ncbi:small acid-soluble spore protein SspI [Psychrobacillus glaciei]|uniref:Small, acid-soluble spore protein I n=1 Tax=Psychrobacillus glaciei TaxID=2283160 RepID=A0A5J6STT6_9BACI|nr:small acid-soluble spore protein SspI [Psychrobacillus glaciei]QFF99657.1 small acid-soluble spore protein SspI [Psychrobacillus glaciei]